MNQGLVINYTRISATGLIKDWPDSPNGIGLIPAFIPAPSGGTFGFGLIPHILRPPAPLVVAFPAVGAVSIVVSTVIGYESVSTVVVSTTLRGTSRGTATGSEGEVGVGGARGMAVAAGVADLYCGRGGEGAGAEARVVRGG